MWALNIIKFVFNVFNPHKIPPSSVPPTRKGRDDAKLFIRTEELRRRPGQRAVGASNNRKAPKKKRGSTVQYTQLEWDDIEEKARGEVGRYGKKGVKEGRKPNRREGSI